MMKRIGVLSDTHLYRPDQALPQPILKAFEGMDLILHAGDWVDLCVLKQLEEIAPVVGVHGNMDCPAVRQALPDHRIVEIEDRRIFLTHGWGPPANLEQRIIKRYAPEADIIVYGHTHRAVCKNENGYFIFNPGSPTDSGYASGSTFGIITLGETIEGQICTL